MSSGQVKARLARMSSASKQFARNGSIWNKAKLKLTTSSSSWSLTSWNSTTGRNMVTGRYIHRKKGMGSLGTLPRYQTLISSLCATDNHDEDENDCNQYATNERRRWLYTNNNYSINHYQQHAAQWKRQYHSTEKREIVPLIALVVVGITARYSYKALQRMDEEWEEYQTELEEYNRLHGISNAGTDVDGGVTANEAVQKTAMVFRGGTMGIDLGSFNIRISHLPNAAATDNATGPKASVVVDREGGRSTPSAILFGDDGNDHVLLGRLAMEKMYQRPVLLNPRQFLIEDANSENKSESESELKSSSLAQRAVQNVISSAAKNALEQSLGASLSNTSTSNTTTIPLLFSVDANASGGTDGYNTRPVFTYPPPPSTQQNHFLQHYQTALASMCNPPFLPTFLPEPTAALLAAQHYNLLPPNHANDPTAPFIVIDVGGTTTSLTLLTKPHSNDSDDMTSSILYHSRLDGIGGETIVQALVEYLSQSFFRKSINEIQTYDGMSVQRLDQASRSAIIELSGAGGRGRTNRNTNTQQRVQINVPYLSVDEKMQPKHLDMGVNAQILEAELDSLVSIRLSTPDSNSDATSSSSTLALSSSMPSPNTLSAAMASAIMNVFETTGQNPFGLGGVLVVGGGARSPIIQKAIDEGLASLVGEQFVQERVVVPREEMVEELVVLGAAIYGSQL